MTYHDIKQIADWPEDLKVKLRAADMHLQINV